MNRSPREAAREVVTQALGPLEGARPDLLLLFATGGYDQQLLVRSAEEISGGVPLSGCSTSGVLTGSGLDESTHAVAALALSSESLRFQTFQVRDLAKNPRACGQLLARQVAAAAGDRNGLLLLFPDGVTGSVAFFLRELQAGLPSGITVAGGTSGSLLKLDRTWQYRGGEAASDAVSAVLLQGDEIIVDTAVTHGCETIGEEQVITRAENGWVYQIDGEPAWTLYRKYLQLEEQQTLSMGESCYICLAERLKEPDPDYGDYIIRCPLQLDREKGALFFPGDLQAGTRVRIALRNTERTLAMATRSAEDIAARHEGVAPVLVLQFDCCCRGQLLFGMEAGRKAVAPLQRAFARGGPAVPWFGFSTYGEIAPLPRGRSYFHNYATVLCALYPKSGSRSGA